MTANTDGTAPATGPATPGDLGAPGADVNAQLAERVLVPEDAGGEDTGADAGGNEPEPSAGETIPEDDADLEDAAAEDNDRP